MRWQAAGTRAAHPQSMAVVLPGGGAVGWRPGESSGGMQGSWFSVVLLGCFCKLQRSVAQELHCGSRYTVGVFDC